MSEVGLGRVKTQRCCDDIEWVFRQATFLIVQASWAWAVAIDFGKLFSSSFNFSSFYTARVKLRRTQCEQMSSGLPLKADIALCGRHVSKVLTGDTPSGWASVVVLCSGGACRPALLFTFHANRQSQTH